VVTGNMGQHLSPSGPASDDAGRPVRLVVNRDRCIGSGQCVLSEPAIFDQDDEDGLVLLRVERPEPAQLAGVRYAVALCPGHALSLDQT
jgi:ferredoxin